jgi:hypothetical protein
MTRVMGRSMIVLAIANKLYIIISDSPGMSGVAGICFS